LVPIAAATMREALRHGAIPAPTYFERPDLYNDALIAFIQKARR
jgi:hypothetical protein